MKSPLVQAVAFLLLLVSTDGQAQELFLCIDDSGFQGDVTIAGYEGCSQVLIALESMRLDDRQTTASPLRLTKALDSMSQALATAMVQSTEIQQARLVRRFSSGDLSFAAEEIRLLNGRISEYGVNSESGDNLVVKEQVALTPERIEWIVRQPTGSADFSITSRCWDIQSNVVSETCR